MIGKFSVSFVCMVSLSLTAQGLDPATISAIAGVISAGASLGGTTLTGLMNGDYRVQCGIEVENWTRFTLARPHVTIGGGALTIPPRAVLPSQKEAMVARKTSDTATGSYGTVSWRIRNRRIVIMWSAPYDFNAHSNWLGVGITPVQNVHHRPDWYDQMYYSSSNSGLRFNRMEYWYTSNPVIYRDNDFEVEGTMGTSHQAQVKIIIRPRNNADMADPIRALLGIS